MDVQRFYTYRLNDSFRTLRKTFTNLQYIRRIIIHTDNIHVIIHTDLFTLWATTCFPLIVTDCDSYFFNADTSLPLSTPNLLPWHVCYVSSDASGAVAAGCGSNVHEPRDGASWALVRQSRVRGSRADQSTGVVDLERSGPHALRRPCADLADGDKRKGTGGNV